MDIEDVPLWVYIIILAVTVAVNAYLSVMRVSVSSLTDGRVRKLAEDGDQDAINMLDTENIDTKLYTAVSFATILVNILGGAFAVLPVSSVIYASFEKQSLGIVFVAVFIFFVSLITVTLGVILPERVAQIKSSEKQIKSRRISAVRLYNILKPTVLLSMKASVLISGAFGVSEDDAPQDVTEDEIMLMVDQGEESGSIETNEKEMIENVFNFSTTTACEVMTHRTNVVAIWIDEKPDEILNTIVETGKSRFPVYDDDIDTITGILIARDYLLNLQSENPRPFRELLRPAYLVPETVKTNVLFKDMQLKNIHMAVVVDEYGGTAGIVTMEDLLEEIVGNIYDEFDKESENKDIVKLEENVWRVAGNVDMNALETALGIDIENEEEYDTLGGLVFSKLSTIPDDGSHPEVFVSGLYIYVEEIKNRRIELARVSLVMGPETEDEHSDEDDE